MVTVAGSIPVKPECREVALAACATMAAATKPEDGCLMYDFYADLADPCRLFVFEEWESRAALDLHSATPHMAAFVAAIVPCLSGELAVKVYEIASVGGL